MRSSLDFFTEIDPSVSEFPRFGTVEMVLDAISHLNINMFLTEEELSFLRTMMECWSTHNEDATFLISSFFSAVSNHWFDPSGFSNEEEGPSGEKTSRSFASVFGLLDPDFVLRNFEEHMRMKLTESSSIGFQIQAHSKPLVTRFWFGFFGIHDLTAAMIHRDIFPHIPPFLRADDIPIKRFRRKRMFPSPQMAELEVAQSAISTFIDFVRRRFEREGSVIIEDAIADMCFLHEGQTRSDGSPYLLHPLEVARRVMMDFLSSMDVVIAALLHDSLEDQASKILDIKKVESSFVPGSDEEKQAAVDLIRSYYGERVEAILTKLTNPSFLKNGSEEEWLSHYRAHVQRAIEDKDALIVKLADFMHNLECTCAMAESDQKELYLRKYLPLIGVFIERLQKGDNVLPEWITTKVIKKLQDMKNLLQ